MSVVLYAKFLAVVERRKGQLGREDGCPPQKDSETEKDASSGK